MAIQATREDIYTRGGLFDEMMDNCFDAAVLIDMNLRIIHHSAGAIELCNGLSSEEAAGRHIKELDPVSDFEGVIKTGKASRYSFAMIQGHNCIQHMIPIYCGNEMIAVLGGIIFRNLSGLKKILLEHNVEQEDNHSLYDQIARIETNYTFSDFIGQSPVVRRVLERCNKLAPLKHSVLIIGETGTGKEILASGIHAAGRQSCRSPLVKINCSAIPSELLESELFGHEKGAFTGAVSSKKGKFELAENGSILLDEIGEMDLKIQAKLLRVLEEKEFERVGGNCLIPLKARIIASTNKNLQALCEQGNFRSDLYYRLCTFEVYIPSLRERREDIPLLLSHFMSRAGLNMPFSPQALNLLINYDWPGNVRQLRNMVNAMDILKDKKMIEEEDIRELLKLPESYPRFNKPEDSGQLFKHVEVQEKEHILRILRQTNMNVVQAARVLKIHRRTLYNKIKKYGIRLDRHSSSA
ncbi:MAG: sigma 54-interacting transcriptional regulator [Peptococcaceae bacterium]|jgi:transcriptional regulator with PAS, ATPase and Fis domain|nr:sigma 54-interacting transcriptional regulator [Peptococcaceae bacterium]MDH7524957.1 sigma 54-interacting transcriptional regulator [Peptococcaceae bacterium]